MIKITHRAGSTIVENTGVRGLEGGAVLRLGEARGRYELRVDVPRDGDVVIEHDDTPVLTVDRGLEEQMPDSVIDVCDTPDGPKLRLDPLPPG